MKMIDVGEKNGGEVATSKNEMYYPSVTVPKKFGDYDVGDKCTIICEGKIRSIREDDRGYSVDIEVHKVGKTSDTKDDKKVEGMGGIARKLAQRSYGKRKK